jgi:hypothetical protein
LTNTIIVDSNIDQTHLTFVNIDLSFYPKIASHASSVLYHFLELAIIINLPVYIGVYIKRMSQEIFRLHQHRLGIIAIFVSKYANQKKVSNKYHNKI